MDHNIWTIRSIIKLSVKLSFKLSVDFRPKFSIIDRAAHVQVDFGDFGGFPHFYI